MALFISQFLLVSGQKIKISASAGLRRRFVGQVLIDMRRTVGGQALRGMLRAFWASRQALIDMRRTGGGQALIRTVGTPRPRRQALIGVVGIETVIGM
jgi:hypothetical protein